MLCERHITDQSRKTAVGCKKKFKIEKYKNLTKGRDLKVRPQKTNVSNKLSTIQFVFSKAALGDFCSSTSLASIDRLCLKRTCLSSQSAVSSSLGCAEPVPSCELWRWPCRMTTPLQMPHVAIEQDFESSTVRN